MAHAIYFPFFPFISSLKNKWFMIHRGFYICAVMDINEKNIFNIHHSCFFID